MFANTTRILIVDDMGTMRKLVTKALKEIGFTDIREAADGAQGWEILSATEPKIELVISDWNMPVSTGLDLLRRVRSDSRFKTMPFVLLTAESEKEQVVEALKAGVSAYLVKPFDVNSLRDQLAKVSTGAAA